MKTRHLLILCFSVMAISSCGHRTSNNNTQDNSITEIYTEPSGFTESITEAAPTVKRINFSITREDLKQLVEYGEILDMAPDEGCAIIQTEEGLKWFSTRLETLIDFPYDYMTQILFSENGHVLVESDEKNGLMSIDGTVVVPCEYGFPIKGGAPYVVYVDGQWGFLGEDGEFLIPPIYEFAEEFQQGLAPVMLNNKWGYINTKGETVIPFIYDSAYTFPQKGHEGVNNITVVGINGLYGIIRVDGEMLTPIEYEYLNRTSSSLFIAEKNGEYGLVDLHGQAITSFEYDQINDCSEGLFPAKKDGKWGFINKKGEIAIPFQYSYVGDFYRNHAIVCEEGSKPILITRDGIVTYHYKRYMPWKMNFSDDLLSVRIQKGDTYRFGFMDDVETIKVPIKYSSTSDFHGGFARVCANGKWGYVDTDGNEYPALTKSTSDRSWLYGTWVPVSNSVSTSDGSFYVVKNVIVSIDKDHIYLSNGNIHYEGSYTANDDEISLGGGKYVSIDGETLTYFGGMFMPVSVEMKKTSNSTTVASQVQEQRSRITFRSQEDVYGYLDFTSFKGNGSTVKIRRDCIYVNERGISGAPRVVSVSGSTAILSYSSVNDGGRTRQVYVYGDEKKIYFPDTRETFYE